MTPPSSMGLVLAPPIETDAIIKALIDAKGDLLAGSAADALGRLAIGANGTILTADSAEALGMKWAAAAGGGGTERFHFHTLFPDTFSRFSTSTSGAGAAVTQSNGAFLDTGTSATGGAGITGPNMDNDLSLGFDRDPAVYFRLASAGGFPASCFTNTLFALGNIGNAGSITQTNKHIGWRLRNTYGTPTLVASVADGTTQTVSADLSGLLTEVSANDYYIKLTSGTEAKFYINGALAATLNTNLPSGAWTNLPMSIAMKLSDGGVESDYLRVQGAGYSYDVLA